MKDSWKSHKHWLNVVLSISCLAWLSSQMQWSQVKAIWSTLSWWHFSAALSVPLFMSIVHVWRWQAATAFVGETITFNLGFRLVYIGYLFNQLLPSSFGGDVIRTWAMRKEGYTWPVSLGSVLLDRIVGLFTLTGLYVLLYPLIRHWLLLSALDWVWGVLALSWLGLITVVMTRSWWRKWVTGIAQGRLDWLHKLELPGTQLFLALTCGCVVHFGIGLSFYILASGLSIPLPLITALVLFPLINLITMVPLSFAGWGVREGVMMFALPHIGILPEQAFALSVSYGVVLTISALPGVLVWWFAPTERLKTKISS
ncbi:MAG: hypothetical protein CMF48_07395 [Legionellales bacterium]|nr:hypothetical protein [Legionellales bacterium]|tara:strand:- start:766 stop:1704 length:939 start_codon:yes stop_codon:yes gene_type:complete